MATSYRRSLTRLKQLVSYHHHGCPLKQKTSSVLVVVGSACLGHNLLQTCSYIRSAQSMLIQGGAALQKHFPSNFKKLLRCFAKATSQTWRVSKVITGSFLSVWPGFVFIQRLGSSLCTHAHAHAHAHINMCDPCPCQGISPPRPLPTQQAGNRGPVPGAAYRDLATALHSLAQSNIHTWPPLPSAGPSAWPPICGKDSTVCEMWCLAGGETESKRVLSLE